MNVVGGWTRLFSALAAIVLPTQSGQRSATALEVTAYRATGDRHPDPVTQQSRHLRALLTDKARGFQIVVFTCRQGDYLSAGAMVPTQGTSVFRDTDGGLTRAIDLGRAIQRR